MFRTRKQSCMQNLELFDNVQFSQNLLRTFFPPGFLIEILSCTLQQSIRTMTYHTGGVIYLDWFLK